jgi:hypothetical protein
VISMHWSIVVLIHIFGLGICFPGLENRLKFVCVTFSSLEWLDN